MGGGGGAELPAMTSAFESDGAGDLPAVDAAPDCDSAAGDWSVMDVDAVEGSSAMIYVGFGRDGVTGDRPRPEPLPAAFLPEP